MKIQPECITCFFRQALDTAEIVQASAEEKEAIIKEFASYLARCDFSQPPPVAGKALYRIVEKRTGVKDPFKELKKESNRFANNLYPQLKEAVFSSFAPLKKAVEFAIWGNIIDYGIKSSLDIEAEKQKLQTGGLDEAAKGTFAFDLFAADVEKAQNILYLADNSGEIVFDRLLIEVLAKKGKHITLAVRQSPIINDALQEDAQACNLGEIAEIISSGVSTPGIVWEETSSLFRQKVKEADLIISKGQGNYEALEDRDLGCKIYFLFRIKCEIVAKFSQEKLGAVVLRPQAEKAVLK